MKTLFKNFLRCGLTGWCLEILFTSLHSLKRRDMTLKGDTSLWMFPIYGMAAFISPLYHKLYKKSTPVRGVFYMCCIFIIEFITGKILSAKSMCPWNYHRSPWHISEVIRLDYAPCWFLTGLLFEKILCPKQPDL